MEEKDVNVGLGEKFRQKREEKGISIATAAMQTNLPSNIIEKLEKNLFSEIGAPVFVRGYLVNYAKYLSLDISEVAKAFSSIDIKKTQVKISNANIASHTKKIKKNKWGAWLTILIIIVIIIALISQITRKDSWLLTQFNKAFSDSTIASDQAGTVASQSQDGLVIEIADNNPDTKDLATEPRNTSELALESDIDSQSGQNLSDASIDELSNGGSVYLPEIDALNNSVNVEASENQFSQQQYPTEEKSDIESLGIQIIPTAENWIEIKNKSGAIVHSGLYQRDQIIKLDTNGAPYDLNVGRPDAFDLLINGEKKPIANYKKPNSNRHFTLGFNND